MKKRDGIATIQPIEKQEFKEEHFGLMIPESCLEALRQSTDLRIERTTKNKKEGENKR